MPVSLCIGHHPTGSGALQYNVYYYIRFELALRQECACSRISGDRLVLLLHCEGTSDHSVGKAHFPGSRARTEEAYEVHTRQR